MVYYWRTWNFSENYMLQGVLFNLAAAMSSFVFTGYFCDYDDRILVDIGSRGANMSAHMGKTK